MNKICYAVAIDHNICWIFFNESAFNAVDHLIKML